MPAGQGPGPDRARIGGGGSGSVRVSPVFDFPRVPEFFGPNGPFCVSTDVCAVRVFCIIPGMTLLRIVLPALRDSFWRGFWRRHQKYLPPAARVSISNVTAHVDRDASVPAFHVEVGRDWR